MQSFASKSFLLGCSAQLDLPFDRLIFLIIVCALPKWSSIVALQQVFAGIPKFRWHLNALIHLRKDILRAIILTHFSLLSRIDFNISFK